MSDTLTCRRCGRSIDLYCNMVDGVCDGEEWQHDDQDGFAAYFADCPDPEPVA